MKITEENKYELIDKFAKGLMSEQESNQFQNLMNADSDLLTEFNLIKELHDVHEFSIQEKKLKQSFESIHKPRIELTKYIKYAIFLLVFGLLSALLVKTIQNSSANSSDNIQIAMLEPLELITKSNEVQSNIRVMQDLYNSKKYNEAMPYILNHLETNPYDLDVLLAKGVSLLETKEYTEAHEVFNKIEKLKPRVKRFAYYQAITFMKQGDIVSAENILEQIVANKTFGYAHAEILLNTIK